jgi:protein-L-isoaspartate(D-aspartate) O-methyltransferase
MRSPHRNKMSREVARMMDFAAAREAMVDCQVRPSDVTRYPIIVAMLDVPREEFVPRPMRSVAYLGEHVPLGPGRVVLDPRVFAKLLDSLDVGPSDLVLDVGCGLGYSTAVVAKLAEAVVAVETPGAMAEQAEANLVAHGADNAAVHAGDLAQGAPAHGLYDAMIVEGGVERLPDALVDQLKPGGRVAAIFMEGALGQARLGIKGASGVAWRRVFDATAPVLPGFEAAKAFEF